MHKTIRVMVLWSILIGLLLLLLALLFVPLNLVLNTVTQQYYIQAVGLAKVKIEGDEKEIIRLRLQALFRNFYFYPIDWIAKPKKIKEGKSKKKKTNHLSPGTILRLLRSFKVKRLWVDVDTGDCITNSKLYPVVALMNFWGGNYGVNFQGRNELVLHIQNRPIRLLRSFINL
ncbi:MAG: hypothetical protein HKN89_02060 [Eudoraea sp.]|nr:hypothetical protein [Eudoraea sp.]